MRTVGLHLRILTDLIDVAQRAKQFNLTSFQCFLIHQYTKKHIRPSDQDIKNFLALRSDFNELYIHGTYWINICGEGFERAHYFLKRELDLARKLDFSHYIMHPGSATGWPHRERGIDCLVRVLNSVTKNAHGPSIVLENTAHGGHSVGSDLVDFKVIREKLDFPEKVSFCIDTSHAHAFGYDMISQEGFSQFLTLLEDVIGIDAIALIHLNDNKEELGKYQDRHDIIGNGVIGYEALKRFANDARLADIPIMLELPDIAHEEQKKVLEMVRHWK